MRTNEEINEQFKLLDDKFKDIRDKFIENKITSSEFNTELREIINIKRTLLWFTRDCDKLN